MNEQQLGYRVKKSLNQSLVFDTTTLEQLKSARESALEHQRQPKASPLWALVWAENRSGNSDGRRFLSYRVLLPAALLILGMLTANSWYQSQRVEEIVEIDAAVLTGELPIDAYLDKGFSAWLKRSLE